MTEIANYMPPTTDPDFLQILDICDPVATDREGWEVLFDWAPGEAVLAWLQGFRAARDLVAG